MDLSQEIKRICREYGVADLYVFGSRAREVAAMMRDEPIEETGSESDVDMGILPEHGGLWPPDKSADLAAELEDVFGVRRVDLVFLPRADAFLAVDIIRGELLFTSDPDRQAEYELFVLRRAGDLLPFQRERVRMILEEGAR
jgi:predicted nucleotidyltransferase